MNSFFFIKAYLQRDEINGLGWRQSWRGLYLTDSRHLEVTNRGTPATLVVRHNQVGYNALLYCYLHLGPVASKALIFYSPPEYPLPFVTFLSFLSIPDHDNLHQGRCSPRPSTTQIPKMVST